MKVPSPASRSFPSEATLARLTRLTHLHLRGVGLEGAVPRSLFALPGLVELDLSHNRLAGELPSALPSADELSGGDFRWPANLHRLALSRNNLTGVVPSSLLALRALRKLYLARNAFEGVEAFPAETPPATNDDAAANETTPRRRRLPRRSRTLLPPTRSRSPRVWMCWTCRPTRCACSPARWSAWGA